MKATSTTRAPQNHSWQVALDTGEQLWVGPALAGDSDLLGGFYESISSATRELYAPHEFSRAYARTLCAELDKREMVPVLATDAARTRVYAYFLLYLHVFPGEVERYRSYGVDLDSARDCMFAPVVADDWQGRGLAGVIMPLYLQVARDMGRRNIILLSGTQRRNTRAVRFYERSGFRFVGYYGDDDFNQDMMLELAPPR